MNRAKVAISPWSARHDGVGLIRIEGGRFLELLAYAHDCVRFLVAVNPRYLLTGLHRDGLRIEGEVFDLNFVLTGATAARVLHIAGYRQDRETTDATQQRCDFDFTN